MDEYTKQANDFLETTKTTFSAKLVRHGLYYPDDKEKRDIYKITLTKGERTYTYKFGQSIYHSGQYYIVYTESKHYERGQKLTKEELKKARGRFLGSGIFWEGNKDFQPPSAYDVLARITKYDPGTFEDFCGEFGDDTDSRSAEKVYKAVKNEYMQVSRLFLEPEINLMAEIQ